MKRPFMNRVSDILVFHALNGHSYQEIPTDDAQMLQTEFCVIDEASWKKWNNLLKMGIVKPSQVENFARKMPPFDKLPKTGDKK